MKSIPRLVAGTAVVLAAVLTTAPVTAGIADFVLNPGQQPTKRAAPALTGSAIAPVAPSRTRDDEGTRDSTRDADDGNTRDITRGDSTRDAPPSVETTPTGGIDSASATVFGESAGLVAHTAADAQSRVTDLAGDLQSGVEAGEFSQADADRVLGDLSSYIRGERTWPERTVA